MVEREIRVRTADGDMTTFTVRPDGDGPFPVAVVFMDGVGYREQVRAQMSGVPIAGVVPNAVPLAPVLTVSPYGSKIARTDGGTS